jgi:hypothetical protein
LPPGPSAGDELGEVGGDVVGTKCALAHRDEQVTGLGQGAVVRVNDDPCSLHQVRVGFAIRGPEGSDQVNMGPRPHVGTEDHRRGRRGGAGDDISVSHSAFSIVDCPDGDPEPTVHGLGEALRALPIAPHHGDVLEGPDGRETRELEASLDPRAQARHPAGISAGQSAGRHCGGRSGAQRREERGLQEGKRLAGGAVQQYIRGVHRGVAAGTIAGVDTHQLGASDRVLGWTQDGWHDEQGALRAHRHNRAARAGRLAAGMEVDRRLDGLDDVQRRQQALEIAS